MPPGGAPKRNPYESIINTMTSGTGCIGGKSAGLTKDHFGAINNALDYSDSDNEAIPQDEKPFHGED